MNTHYDDGSKLDKITNEILRYDKLSQTEGLVITVRLPVLLANLGAWMSGFPTGLESGPPEVDEHGVAYPQLTKVEQGASSPDKARRVQARLRKLMEIRFTAEREIADLCTLLGNPAAKPNQKPAEQDADWCVSCLRIERCEPRLGASPHCSFCTGYLAETKRLPSHSLLRDHHTGKPLFTDAKGRVTTKRSR